MARHKVWDMLVVRISSVAPMHTKLGDLLFHPSVTALPLGVQSLKASYAVVTLFRGSGDLSP